jgi:hypothetical protein
VLVHFSQKNKRRKKGIEIFVYIVYNVNI